MEVIEKPWGREEIWAATEHYVGKFLYINAGHKLSRQYHREKEETIYVVEGTLVLELGTPGETNYEKIILGLGAKWNIKPKTIHRFCAPSGGCKLIEVSSPQIDDVVRIEDDYNRVK